MSSSLQFTRAELNGIAAWLRAHGEADALSEQCVSANGPTTNERRVANTKRRAEKRHSEVRRVLAWRKRAKRKWRRYMKLFMRAKRRAEKDLAAG